MHTRCDATCVDTSTVASLNLCTASNSVEAIGDNSNALIALPLQEVDTIPITMVSPAKQISSQQLYSKRCDLIEEEQKGGVEVVETHTQAIVEGLEVALLAKNQVVKVESPNRVLHNIVSHNIDVNHNCNSDTDSTLIAEGLKEVDSNGDLWEVQLEVDISPRLLKSARKEKKEGNGKNSLPIRVQPKRVKSKSNK
ncbi:hypothetical protein KY285_020565 [Solanum tuberosum]|nr:hypothetical protein KY285_020565 [Solanum tuberosum]